MEDPLDDGDGRPTAMTRSDARRRDLPSTDAGLAAALEASDAERAGDDEAEGQDDESDLAGHDADRRHAGPRA